eukprot:COSAG03_NODE_1955_length_3303_cov_2.141386_2_plen_481_part_00
MPAGYGKLSTLANCLLERDPKSRLRPKAAVRMIEELLWPMPGDPTRRSRAVFEATREQLATLPREIGSFRTAEQKLKVQFLLRELTLCGCQIRNASISLAKNQAFEQLVADVVQMGFEEKALRYCCHLFLQQGHALVGMTQVMDKLLSVPEATLAVLGDFSFSAAEFCLTDAGDSEVAELKAQLEQALRDGLGQKEAAAIASKKAEDAALELKLAEDRAANDRAALAGVKVLLDAGVKFPPPDEWEVTSGQGNLTLIDVKTGTAEWTAVEQSFSTAKDRGKTMVKVERIQNVHLWNFFAGQKVRLAAIRGQPLAETLLWHGTGRNDPKLVFNGESGFDTRFSSKGLFGTGTYFAVNASYSASPAYSHATGDGSYTFILARVLTGNAFEMTPFTSHKPFPNMPPRTPFSEEISPQYYNVAAGGRGGGAAMAAGMEPEPEPEHGIGVEGARFDSITGKTGGSDVFITHENGRAYPAYCVTFQ